MNTTIEQHIDNALNTKIRPLLVEAAQLIEALKPGEKIPATELASRLGAMHGMNKSSIYPVLKFMFDGYPGVEIRKGAGGGIKKLPTNT
jgi:hypothetical protein